MGKKHSWVRRVRHREQNKKEWYKYFHAKILVFQSMEKVVTKINKVIY